LDDLDIQLGERMFRSYVFLFGFLPIDYSDMTLVALERGRGFVEESPMGSMSLWRHARRIQPLADDPGSVLLADELTFEPRVARGFIGWFIKRVFAHRHRVLQATFKKA
jgi:ligand-binding SRPBCC domain-containing protein